MLVFGISWASRDIEDAPENKPDSPPAVTARGFAKAPAGGGGPGGADPATEVGTGSAATLVSTFGGKAISGAGAVAGSA